MRTILGKPEYQVWQEWKWNHTWYSSQVTLPSTDPTHWCLTSKRACAPTTTPLELTITKIRLPLKGVLADYDLGGVFYWFEWVILFFNSLAPGKCEWNFRYVIFKHILVIGGWGISCEIAPIWMSLEFTDDQSTLVQVLAWCRHATSHYLSQCWPRSLSSYGVTIPEWVNWCYWPAHRAGLLRCSFLVSQEVYLNFHHFCG